jgi:ferritin-like metal-binding protein YciE
MAKSQTTALTKSSNAKSSNSNGNGNSTSSSSQNKNGMSKEDNKDEKTLKKLFEQGLQDIYNAEQQLIEALPEMAKAAYNEDLEDAITNHLEETKKQASRLEKIFDRLNIEKEGETCKAMEGLIEEGKKIIQEYPESPVRDSALIIGAQKIEHYEIAAYGSLCELADVLGFYKVAEVLDRSLAEEEQTDGILTDIAKDVNDEAMEMSEEKEKEYV